MGTLITCNQTNDGELTVSRSTIRSYEFVKSVQRRLAPPLNGYQRHSAILIDLPITVCGANKCKNVEWVAGDGASRKYCRCAGSPL